MYDNAPDANRYLGGTVCMWGEMPVYVHDCIPLPEGGIGARCSPARDVHDNVSIYRLDDPQFNAFKFRLGYLNMANEAVYISRRPARIQAQGLSPNSLSYRRPGAGRAGMSRDRMRTYMAADGFAEMLNGRYPSLAEAHQRMVANPQLRSVAFNQHLALRRHEHFNNLIFLCYKGQDISFGDGVFEFRLPEEFQYLTEVCTENGCIERNVA